MENKKRNIAIFILLILHSIAIIMLSIIWSASIIFAIEYGVPKTLSHYLLVGAIILLWSVPSIIINIFLLINYGKKIFKKSITEE